MSETVEESLKLNPTETALILIEYQNEFTTEGGKLHDAVKEVMEATGMLENSKKLMDTMRSSKCKIFHCPILYDLEHSEIGKNPYGILAGVKEGKAFQEGEWGGAICDVMKPSKGDTIVKGKNGLCAFKSTNLDFILRQNEIKNIVLGGFLTNCCVESTMRTAYENGYRVYTLKDCCAATSMAAHEAAIEHTFGMFSIPTTSAEVAAAVSI
eukprot:CAMPEP_0197833566 /NCGR_PEP_ID=MMETSP1437-20131217/19451_1 /TAXON_ID=49252 ORGANISM="Eucampia antarctica, Strain CCMP1452" /NCGR_SAMPLE_ID=MMETSP1437 /ASSEMBLY_ACC=CAM_ASM_001096 /LENGTH=210 /DNA_ID=CAMNT_0043437691 /DNA_START=51 /DNA_END=683 /DNA_ORIENTATION=+